MTVKRGTIGTGITEKPTVSWNDIADQAEAEVAALLERGTLAGMVAATERDCFTVLVEIGLPGKHGCYIFNSSGEWRESGPPPRGWSVANTVEPVARARGFAPDSPVGFAARMLDRIFWLRDAQRRGDHDEAVLWGIRLGILKAESRIKAEQESTWQSGKATREGAHKGGEAKREHVEARHRLIRASYDDRRRNGQDHPTALKGTASQFKLSPRQMRRIVREIVS